MPSFRVIAALGGCLFENILDLEFLKTICTLSREIQLCYMQTTKTQISLHTGSFISAFVSRKCIWQQKYHQSFKQFGSVRPDLKLNCLLMLSADKKWQSKAPSPDENPLIRAETALKAQTSLCISAVWSAHLFFAHLKVSYLDLLRRLVWVLLCLKSQRQVLSRRGPLLFLVLASQQLFSFGCFKRLLTCFRLRIVESPKPIQKQFKF